MKAQANGKRNIVIVIVSAIVAVLLIAVISKLSTNQITEPVKPESSNSVVKSSSSTAAQSNSSTVNSSENANSMPYAVDFGKNPKMEFQVGGEWDYMPKSIGITIDSNNGSGLWMNVSAPDDQTTDDDDSLVWSYAITTKNIPTKTVHVGDYNFNGDRVVKVNTEILVGKTIDGKYAPDWNGQIFYAFPNKWGKLSIITHMWTTKGMILGNNDDMQQEYRQVVMHTN